MATLVETYTEVCNTAGEDLRVALSTRGFPDSVEGLKAAIDSEFQNELKEGSHKILSALMGRQEGPETYDVDEDALDDMGPEVGESAAEKFARELGIEDEVILEQVRKFGKAQAMLWIEESTALARSHPAALGEIYDDYDF